MPPPTATIVKTFTFEAAHQLPNHSGKCRQPHGHSYRVDVVMAGPIKPERGESDDGMVRDFGDVKTVWRERIEPFLDHQDLNHSIGRHETVFDIEHSGAPWSIPVARCWPTTAENIAVWLVAAFRVFIPEVVAVRVWETATSHAIAEASR